jgi:hypothetical protein
MTIIEKYILNMIHDGIDVLNLNIEEVITNLWNTNKITTIDGKIVELFTFLENNNINNRTLKTNCNISYSCFVTSKGLNDILISKFSEKDLQRCYNTIYEYYKNTILTKGKPKTLINFMNEYFDSSYDENDSSIIESSDYAI